MKGHDDLKADVERAWMEYNTVVSKLPDCKHVRAWTMEYMALREVHLKALRKLDRAVRAADLPQAGKDIR